MKSIKEIRLAIVLLICSATAVFGATGFNSGKAFPYIANDEESAVFIAMAITYAVAEQAGLDARQASRDLEDAAGDGIEVPYLQYGRDLAKTLSTLTEAEQDVVWYGN